MKFMNRLKELRNENGLSQAQLSKKTNISLSAIGKWEAGLREPSAYTVIILAKFFGVTTDYLLGIDDK